MSEINNNLNLESIDQSEDEIKTILAEAIEASEDLRMKLSHIKVKIPSTEGGVIEAIRQIFGNSYISDSGESYITYDMYCSIINLIRVVGNNKAQEIL